MDSLIISNRMTRLNLVLLFILFSAAILRADTTAQAAKDTFRTDSPAVLSPASPPAEGLAPAVQTTLPEARKRNQTTEVWVFVVCCLTFFLAGLNRRINEKRHDQSILGFLNVNLLGQSTERSFYEFNIHQLIGLIVHNLIVALWCFYFLNETDYQFVNNNLLFFILLFFLVSIVYLSKFFFQYLSLNILQINDLPVLLVKCTIGLGYFTFLISLPLFMVIYYVQYTEWHEALVRSFMVLMSVYLLFRCFKYLQLFAQFFGASIFYNILYFCALELIPLLVLIKISRVVF